MRNCCFLCNTQNGLVMQKATNFFGSQNTLPSGSLLSDTLGSILHMKLQEDKVHTNLLCKLCLKKCTDYDALDLRLCKMKSEMLEQFKQVLSVNNIEYEKYENHFQKSPRTALKRLVLPASKLQPLPPDMLLKVGKIQLSKTDGIPKKPTTTSSMYNLKVTVGSSVLTQTIKTTTSTLADIQTSTLPRQETNFLPTVMKVESDDDERGDDDDGKGDDDENDDEQDIQTMEIDEDCALTVMPVTTSTDGNLVLQVEGIKRNQSMSSSLEEFLNVPALHDDTEDSPQKYVLSNFEILEEDDDEEAQTIVLNSDNCSLLRMVNGQKLMYDGSEFSFMMPDEDDSQNGDQDAADAQVTDSNDESQIELQVSGDEETANAIIAAAKEQGGAFIKVESGEMFRVKSVQSNNDAAPLNIVEKDGKNFKCLLCENSDKTDEKGSCTGDAQTIMSHLKAAHDARIYICQVCGGVMRKRSDYTTHIAEHAQKLKTASRAHACPTCGKQYPSRALLAEHQHVHSGARPYACSHCDKTFASKYTLQAHLKTHQERPRPFKCSQCGRAFLTQQNLNQHEKTHSGARDFICSVCNKAFSTQHNLEVHAVVHSGTRAFACGACGKAFARRAELRDHARIHTGERPFECDICGARFTQRSNLHSHKRATHLDDKRYHCTQCPKRFKRRRLLEYHIKGTHTGERPLKCDKCPSAFVYPEHYKKHIRIHSGERPYLCEVCGKAFTSRDNRNTHRFTHSDKKPYECVRCGAGYMRKQLLYAHIRASGHLAESIVVNQPRVSTADNNIQAISNQQLRTQTDTVFEINELDESVKSIEPLTEVSEGNILEAVDADQLRELGEQAEIVATCDGGGVVRLIPVHLADGNSGWVALDR